MNNNISHCSTIILCSNCERRRAIGGVLFLLVISLVASQLAWQKPVVAQITFEREPINYGKPPFLDPVSKLQAKLDAGETKLEYDSKHGYLPALLKLLEIKPSSQVLVNSKTSFQLQRISRRKPRAVYFNDKTYLGWVQNGDVVEIMTTDPVQGEMFYTLRQDKTEHPKFVRDKGQCIVCHASSRTQGVPGGLIRSVYVNPGGQPQFGSGTFNTDHTSPFKERWGGWYVSGTHGEMRHMGNVASMDRDDAEVLDREAGANVTDLTGLFNVSPYLTPHSDIVALLVLEHQTQMQNFITLASYESRSTEHYDNVMNDALDRPKDFVSDTSKRRIASAGDKLLRYLLFSGEFRLASPVKGTSDFTREFQAEGPRDSQGRSLRDLDLQKRLFKYPCSYLVYSPAFDQLPKPVKRHVVLRLHDVLTEKDTSEEFSHLTTEDRKAILEILTETKPGIWDIKADDSQGAKDQ